MKTIAVEVPYIRLSQQGIDLFCTEGPPTQPSLCVDAMHVIRIPLPLQACLSQVPRGALRRCRRRAVSIEIDKTIAAAARMHIG